MKSPQCADILVGLGAKNEMRSLQKLGNESFCRFA
jgi:hypothetical protein